MNCKNANNDSLPIHSFYLSVMFKELKVLELASVLAGPSVGQFFAELGAEVIKIENPATGGDVTRSWKLAGEETDDRSAYFCSCNWGKKSVLLDLGNPVHLEKFYKLVASVDIVIASYKPGDSEKLKVDYEALSKVNPRLIYGQITGYGLSEDRVGYDAVVQAESGFMDMNGYADSDPLKLPVALIDVLAAHQLKEALLIALYNREKTGKGNFVSISLFDTAVASLANQATNWLVAGKIPVRQGSLHPNIAPYGEVFLTSDNQRILLAVGSDRQFSDLCNTLDLDDLCKDQRFNENQSRIKFRKALSEELEIAIRKISAEALMVKLNAKKIPGGIIKNIKSVFETSQAQKSVIHSGGLLGVRQFPAEFLHNFNRVNLSPPPKLGADTDDVLKNLL
jgi:crotonobetainyl-CoA:carnitine CoA-transferase CaiB-like acyl-CoA transferase